MFLAHYGAAFAARRALPDESAGSTVLAAQWPDLLWPLFLLLGLESVRIVPGLMEASALDFVHFPWTHSLLMVLGWAAVVGGLHALTTRRRRGALVLAALVVSHWLLDAPVHRPDLPLWPGSDVLVGAALWRSVAATLALELAVFGAGLVIYARSTRPRDGIGRWGLVALAGTLVVFFLSAFAAPPPSETALAWGGLMLWAFVPWAAWVDRHREALARGRPRAG